MNNQQQPLTSEELYALTLSATPGKDQFSKTLLRNDEIKSIIIASLLDSTYTDSSYYHAPTEHKDNRRIDIAYYPVTASDSHPPIIVEIQHKISQEYINRLMRYALNVIDDTNTLPIVLVININGFSSREFEETNFKKQKNEPYYTLPSNLWAEKVYIYNADSIVKSLAQPMTLFIALVHVLTQQQKHIVALDEYNDPSVQKIYKIAKDMFNEQTDKEAILKTNNESFCDAVALQFQKIVKQNNKEDKQSRKKIQQYALDGIKFAEAFKKQITETESESVTPIELKVSEDLKYVKKYLNKKGKTNWKKCFQQGSAEELFERYTTHATLKMAFHRRKL